MVVQNSGIGPNESVPITDIIEALEYLHALGFGRVQLKDAIVYRPNGTPDLLRLFVLRADYND